MAIVQMVQVARLSWDEISVEVIWNAKLSSELFLQINYRALVDVCLVWKKRKFSESQVIFYLSLVFITIIFSSVKPLMMPSFGRNSPSQYPLAKWVWLGGREAGFFFASRRTTYFYQEYDQLAHPVPFQLRSSNTCKLSQLGGFRILCFTSAKRTYWYISQPSKRTGRPLNILPRR